MGAAGVPGGKRAGRGWFCGGDGQPGLANTWFGLSYPGVTLPLPPRLPHAAGPGSDTYTASIPAAAAPVGALVRWFVRATDVRGQVTRDPPFLDDGDRQYWGTIVEDAGDQSSLPVMEL